MEGKKISFGFSKVTKKPALQLNKASKEDDSCKIELIKCLEGQQIKLVEERQEAPPLVIPLKDGGKTSAALASLAKRRAVLLGEEIEPGGNVDNKQITTNGDQPVDTQNLDARAEREILADLQAKTDESNQPNLVLPVVKPDELPLDGAKESTLDDYDSIPIGQYGWAMLRGMGAVEPPKSGQKTPMENGPTQRPPGLGLGADKSLKPKPLLEMPEANEKLEIKKQAFVRILAGKYKDAYGQIEGFDHERGTIIVKLAIGSSKQKFQEFLCQPVSKKEYTQYSKCINKSKYEEYKKLENEHGQVIVIKDNNEKVKAENSRQEVQKNKILMQITDEKSEQKNNSDFGKHSKSDDFPRTSGNHHTKNYRGRSRTRSPSQPKNYSSRREYDSTRYEHKKQASDSDSASDSTYERRKSKSHRSKSKSHKKKHKQRYGSSNDTDSESNDTDDRHKHDKKKRSKKKTKKSKRERSRSPTRRRR